jgi:hypothetical protein
MRVVLPVVVSAARLNISPPRPILTEWMASNRLLSVHGQSHRLNFIQESHLGWTMLQENEISQRIAVAQRVKRLIFACYPQDAAYLPSLLERLLGNDDFLKHLQVPDSQTIRTSTRHESPT